MMRRLGRALRRWRAAQGGATAIEFAVAGPILFLMVAGIVEFGTVMFTSVLMEGALREASRFGVTGQIADPNARLVRIREIVGDKTIGLVDMNQAVVEVKVYPSFADIGRGEAFVDGDGDGVYDVGETFVDENGNGAYDADIGVSGPGGARDIVVYTLRYDWPLFTPLVARAIGAETIPLSASVAVRNEPWEDDLGA